MSLIIKASEKDYRLLSQLAKATFIESHGISARPADINNYVTETYSEEILKEELSAKKNIYHIIYHDKYVAGYSKIIFNSPHPNSTSKNITKLERLYLLSAFYRLKLGSELFRFNIELSKRNQQSGMWLFVWKENHRAINFYKRHGFHITGSHDFKISRTHSNPNYVMFLDYVHG